MKKTVYLIFLSFLCCFKVSAQEKISAFDSLVATIEKSSSVRIYYDPKQTAEIKIPSIPAGSSPEGILKAALAGSGLNFASDGTGRIFITKDVTIQTSLPSDFFVYNPAAKPKQDTIVTVAKKADAVAVTENKVYIIGQKGSPGTAAVLNGYIRDVRSGEPLSGASVLVEDQKIGVATDPYGFFSVTIPKGRHVLKITSLGMKETRRQIQIEGNGRLDIEVKEDVTSLKAAVIVAQKQSNVRGMQMGVEKLTIKTIREIPPLFGEVDILRSLLTLPGVTSVGEGTAGFNVRGGAADQNLILLNDITLYNPTHLFGMFSAVDPDVIKGLELYKSAIPEKYGGRISSVMDVSTREGNSKKFTGSAGIGPLTSKLTLEGPIGSEKTTFLFGGRASYSDWILKQIDNPEFQKSKASFYDMVLHLSHEFSEKDRIFLTAYMSNDLFKLNEDSTYSYKNRNISMKWKHDFSRKFYMVLTGGIDDYQYQVDGSNHPQDAFTLKFGVKQINTKLDFNYAPNNKNAINFGVQNIIYRLQPGSLQPDNAASLVIPNTLEEEKGTETAVYLGDQYKVTDKLSIQAGVRYSFYRYVGPQKVYTYAPGQPLSENTIIDSTFYGNGQLIQTYHGPEVRLSARYLINDRSSFKLSFNTLRQYIHMLTNTAAISPTDTWKLSDPFVEPQVGKQISAGYYTQLGKKGVELTLEAYYKTSKNYLDYKSGARLIMNPNIEQDVITTIGRAYGIEMLLKKPNGKLNGWLSYTYSRTFLQEDDPLAGETINNGNEYPANYDKPNVLSLVANYRFNQRFSISLSSTYSTGRPITLPVGTFNMGGAPRVYYSERNAYRVPDYFRTDISATLEGNHNQKQKVHTSWTAGVYNVTGRDNPYSVYFILEDGKINGYQLSIFASAIPFISFNLRF